MFVDVAISGGDRIAFEEQPPGPQGSPGTPGASGNAYQQRTASGALADGAVVKSITGGSVQTASVTAQGSSAGVVGVVHPATADGSVANVYGTGGRCPMSGIPAGDYYRNGGTAVLYGALTSGTYSQHLYYSDGTALDVNIGEEFPVP